MSTQVAREDPRFEVIEAQIALFNSLSSSHQPPNWPLVVRLAQELLVEAQPDLLVAAWAAVALTYEEGLKGLALGLDKLTELLATSWETLNPPLKKPKVRAGIIQWCLERQSLWLQSQTLNGEPKGRQIVLEALTRLGQTLNNLLGEDLTAFFRAEIAATLETPVLPKAPVPLTLEALTQSALIESPKTNLDNSALPSYGELKAMALKLAQALGENDPQDPASYSLRRWALWSLLKNPPPLVENRLSLPSPPPDLLEGITKIFQTDPLKALQQAESQASLYIYALDFSHLSSLALKALGASYERALAALEGAVRAFVEPWPELLTASFEDGSPLANEGTKLWLKEILGQKPMNAPAIKPKSEPKATFMVALAPKKLKVQNNAPAKFQETPEFKPLEFNPINELRALEAKLLKTRDARSTLKIYARLLELANKASFPKLVLAIGPKTLKLLAKYQVAEFEPNLAIKVLYHLRRATLELLAEGENQEDWRELSDLAQKELIALSPHLGLFEMAEF